MARPTWQYPEDTSGDGERNTCIQGWAHLCSVLERAWDTRRTDHLAHLLSITNTSKTHACALRKQVINALGVKINLMVCEAEFPSLFPGAGHVRVCVRRLAGKTGWLGQNEALSSVRMRASRCPILLRLRVSEPSWSAIRELILSINQDLCLQL